MTIDYKDYPILYVDDEMGNLVTVRYILDRAFELITATNGEEALRILHEREDIAVLMCDQRMPGLSGIEVCEAAREIRPEAIRILITAHSDMHAAIEAINRGKVLRYVTKPFRNEELIEVLRTGVELVHIQRTVRDMEVRLLQAGQGASARTVEAGIAHEMGNFLQALEMTVHSVAHALEGALDSVERDAPRARALLESARESHADSAAGVQQLIDMVKRLRQGEIRASAPARSAADRVVDSTARILRAEIKKVARLQVIVEGTPRVPMEASILGQVVMNLLLNAAHAVKDQGPEVASIVVKVAEMGDRAMISVTDSGPGIPTEHLGRIFDPHFTTKTGGDGLGLAIVREMVMSAGGKVSVSTGATGTSFTIDLPRVNPSTTPPASA